MKPNHICKLSTCRKEYYACNYCDYVENYKSVACCKEHYDLYVKEVLVARAKGEKVDILPDRTDMSKTQIKALKKRPRAQVLKETKEELKAYADENGDVDIIDAVEKINKTNENNKK